MVRLLVDHYIVLFDMDCNLETRNEIILDVFRLIEKKYLVSPNAKFENDKKTVISIVVKSYLIRKINKEKKDL